MKRAESHQPRRGLRSSLAGLAFALLVLAGCGEGNAQTEPAGTPLPEPTEPTVYLEPLGGAPVAVAVEVVATPQGRARGLMFREDLAPGTGMLFVFPTTKYLSFWMRNTLISLDILYLDASGTIVKIHRNTTPYSEESLPSERPARFVLEVSGGYCAEVGIRAGDRVELGELADTQAT